MDHPAAHRRRRARLLARRPTVLGTSRGTTPAREITEELLDRPQVERDGQPQQGTQARVAVAPFEPGHGARRQPAEPDEHVLADLPLATQLDDPRPDRLQARLDRRFDALR